MTHIELGNVPSGPLVIEGNHPVNFYCTADGKRVVYGSANNGTVCSRLLPDQMDLKTKVVQTFVTGNGCPIMVAAVSPDGATVAGGDHDGTVYLWKCGRDGVKLQTLNLGMKEVRITDLCFSDDSQRLALVGTNPYSRKLGMCISTDAGTALGTLEGHTLGILSVSFRQKKPYMIATAGADGRVAIHSGPPCKLLHSAEAHRKDEKGDDSRANCVRFAPSGDHLISCGDDGRVLAWSLRNGEIERVFPVSKYALFGLAWSADNARFVAVGADRRVHIVQFDTGATLDEVSLYASLPETPVGVQWSTSDWITVVSGSGKLWGLKTHQQQRFVSGSYFLWQGLNAPPTVIMSNPNQLGRLIVGDQLGTLLFLTGQESEPRAVYGLKLPVPAPVISIVVGIVNVGAVVSGDGVIRIFALAPEQKIAPRVMTAEESMQRARHARVEDTAQATLKVPKVPGSSLMRVVSQYDDGTLELNSSGTAMIMPATEDVWVCSHTFNDPAVAMCSIDQGNAVVVLCSNGCIYAYPLAQPGTNFVPLWSTRLDGRITGAAVTSDGTLLAIALSADANYPAERLGTQSRRDSSDLHVIEIYEIDDTSLEGLRFVCVYDLHSAEITALALNASGAYLASVDLNRNICVVEIETGEKLVTKEWQAHTAQVTCLAWSPDGTKLASGGRDTNVYVWDVNRIQDRVQIKDAHPGGVACLEFVYNNVLLTGGAEGLLTCYELFTETAGKEGGQS